MKEQYKDNRQRHKVVDVEIEEFDTWDQDCKRWMGRTLRGKFSHYCCDWDFLPIDETCIEFRCCFCFEETQEIKDLKKKLKYE